MRKVWIRLVAAVLAMAACTAEPSDRKRIDEVFAHPPQSAKPMVWWHWMNGNITPDGLRKDILWMHSVGIGGFHIFDAGLDTPQVVDHRLGWMTPEWKEAFRGAVALADSLGMEVSIAASPGWSCTGGPWVAPEDAMKKITWRSRQIQGGARVDVELPKPFTVSSRFQNMPLPYEYNHHQDGPIPEWYYKDIAVYAVKLPEDYHTMQELGARVSCSGGDLTLEELTDGDLDNAKGLAAPAGKPLWVQYEFPQEQSFKAVTVGNAIARNGGHALPAKCRDSLLVSNDGVHWRTLCGITQGAAQQQTEYIPQARARFWRLQRNPVKGASHVGEFVLHSHTLLNHPEEKAGFAYTCDLQAYPSASAAVPASEVIDVTPFCKDGLLEWDAPEGRWMIYRMGCSLCGKKNHPASPEATGLEVDKLDKDAFSRYLHTFLDMNKEAAGELLGKRGIRYLMIDSYESGAQNWTETLPAAFLARRGYDMMPWLPAVAGVVLESTEATEQFLWDFRRTIGELFAENYDNASAIVREDYGMTGIFIESHEHGRSCPADGMSIKKTAAYPMSAMWMEGSAQAMRTLEGQADIKESASVAHIYGQNLVAAESLTISGKGGKAFTYYPGNLKAAADRELAAGVNRFVIHESAHQPVDDRIPGVGLFHYGQWFQRHETWAADAAPWIAYLTRSSALLQYGRYVADWLYYYGEDTNITAQFSRKALETPFGYSYDIAGPEVLLKELSVRSGKLVTRSGMEYSTLVVGSEGLPMSAKVRARINAFKKQGVRVLEGINPAHYVGKTIEPDLIVDDRRELHFVHRSAPDVEIYWVGSLMDCRREVEASFRISGRKPRLYHPESGEIRELPYRFENGRTIIPLHFEREEAYFVVFGESVATSALNVPREVLVNSTPVDGAWRVTFQEGRGAPAAAVFERLIDFRDSPVPGIRYFSGKAVYHKDFSFEKEEGRYALNLGAVGCMATVRLNGVRLPQLWKAPYRVDVTEALMNGNNTLEVEVTNLWVNRLVGDAALPEKDRLTYFTFDFYKKCDRLLPSGLMGPVCIERYSTQPLFASFPNPDMARAIFENPALASLNATPYDALGAPAADTPAPDGYKPVYISHYGRHGARTGSPGSKDLESYTRLAETLSAAGDQLTPEGEVLLAQTRKVMEATAGMEGRLTERGKREHKGIAARMYSRFGAVFSAGGKVYALGSEYPRCLVSMASFTGELGRLAPQLEITLNSGPEYQKIIHNTSTPAVRNCRLARIDSLLQAMNPPTEALLERLFKNPSAASAYVQDPVEFSRWIFRTGRIARGLDIPENIFGHLPFETLYAWVDFYNATIYLGHGNSLEFGDDRMAQTRLLVNDFVNRADECLETGARVADLRFGHDFTLLALCARLGMRGVGERYNYEEARKHFFCSPLIPFAANLQMVFYKKAGAPVLVKCLLNEREMVLEGLESVHGVYYLWEDLRARLVPTMDYILEAHRGICNRIPENTLPSFKAAAQSGRYGGMETDVQMTADGVLVLMHDDTLERTTDGIGQLSDYTWKELSRLRITGGYGWSPEWEGKLRIPLFTEYLDICREGGLIPYVELKRLSDEGVAKTIETLHAKGFSDDEFVLTSFTRHYLDVAGELCGARREFMKGRFSESELRSLQGSGLVIRPSALEITPEMVAICRLLGLEMEAFGLPVGDAALLARLRSWGVLGSTCNDWINLL